MKNLLFTLISLLVFNVQAQIKISYTEPLSIGETKKIESLILNERRIPNVYLPVGYDKEKEYSVIYLLDGGIDEDLLHIVGLTQFFDMMYEMPESIVVGIANVDRKRDFTHPTNSQELLKEFPTAGHSATFIDFLEQELIPFIDSTYKTNSTRFLLGQSLGGLLATEILLKKPELFSHYFITSPSLWWDDESLLKDAQKLLNEKHKNIEYLYVAIGSKEDKQMIKEAKEIYDVFDKSKFKPKKTYFKEVPETHATILHYSIIEGFKNLFPERY